MRHAFQFKRRRIDAGLERWTIVRIYKRCVSLMTASFANQGQLTKVDLFGKNHIVFADSLLSCLDPRDSDRNSGLRVAFNLALDCRGVTFVRKWHSEGEPFVSRVQFQAAI